MSKKRIFKDRFILVSSWILSLVSVVVLIAILIYIFTNGFSSLSINMITGNFNSRNVIARVEAEYGQAGNYPKPANLPSNAFYSPKFGIALDDTVDKFKSASTAVVYIAPNSPLTHAASITAGEQGENRSPFPGMILKKLTYIDADGNRGHIGPNAQKMAEESINDLEKNGSVIYEYFGQSLGGGIRGSIITSVMLIVMTLVIVLPLGISAAIWLNEVAPKKRLTGLLRTGIDMLAGVPSIIFGLMGMTTLYPITAAFGIQGQSIVLGGLTMSVVLLPLVIRQTEEALKTVPISMRMGSLSLGASLSQTIFKVVLPQAMPGIVTAVLLSISRIIGESAALIYTMGTAITDNPRFSRGATTLALHIWKVMSGDQPDFEQATAISIVILVLVLILNFGTRLILHKLSKNQLKLGEVKKSEAREN